MSYSPEVHDEERITSQADRVNRDSVEADMYHLIYASKAKAEFSADKVLSLLQKSRAKNKARGITGMLLYDDGCFLQVLEGKEDVVKQLFSMICADERHHVVKIIAEAIPKRQFKGWTMGYASVPRQELKTIEGMNDFFDDHTCLADIGKGRARKILNAFLDGRWRLE